MTKKAMTEESSKEPEPVAGLAKGRGVFFHPGTKEQTGELRSEVATVAHVFDVVTGRCNLGVLNSEGVQRPVHDVPYSAEPHAGTWSWPPKV